MRAALPSSLVGLVTFSFVALAFGTSVYLAALPSLVSGSPVVSQIVDGSPTDSHGASTGDEAPSDDSATAADGSGATEDGSDGAGSDEASGDVSTHDADGGSDATDEGSDQGGTVPGLPELGASSPRRSLNTAATSAAGDTKSQADAESSRKENGTKAEDGKTETTSRAANASSNSERPKDSHGGSASAGGGGSSHDTPQEDPEKDDDASDEESRTRMREQAARLQALEGELEGLNDELANTFLADLGTRQASKRHAEAYLSRAVQLAGETRNTPSDDRIKGMATSL